MAAFQRFTVIGFRVYFATLALLLTAVALTLTLDLAQPFDRLSAGVFLLVTAGFLLHSLLKPRSDQGNSPGLGRAAHQAANDVLSSLPIPTGIFIAGRFASHIGYSAPLGWTVAVVAPLTAYIVFSAARFLLEIIFGKKGDPPMTQFIRGTYILTPDQAHERSKQLLANNGHRTIFWGGLTLPEEISEGHFLVVGATGSGKTITLRLLMQSVLPRIVHGGVRAVVYDAKKEALSQLEGMGVPYDRIRILNPFDKRAFAWDMAADIVDPATADQIAAILIPEEDSQNRFFTDAARDLLGGVFKAFMLTRPKEWSFADAIHAMQSPERLKTLLKSTPETADIADIYFTVDTTMANIHSTVRTRMAPFATIAALWKSRGKDKMSLQEWADGNLVLLLGKDERLRASLDAINRVLFERLVHLALERPGTGHATTWFFLDELRWAGKLELLNNLAVAGRSKGVRVVLGFQDIDGLRDVYGDYAATELAGICANKAILRLDSPATAQWAAENIGDAEQREYTQSFSKERPGEPRYSDQVTKREAALASEILRLPIPDKQRTVFHGYYVTPAIGVYHGQVHFGPLLGRTSETDDYVPADRENQYIRNLEDKPSAPENPPPNLQGEVPKKPRRSLDDLPKMTLGEPQPPAPDFE